MSLYLLDILLLWIKRGGFYDSLISSAVFDKDYQIGVAIDFMYLFSAPNIASPIGSEFLNTSDIVIIDKRFKDDYSYKILKVNWATRIPDYNKAFEEKRILPLGQKVIVTGECEYSVDTPYLMKQIKYK